MRGISSEYYPVAVHEYVHILLKPVKNMPIWLNEGLAELYSSLRPVGKKLQVGDFLPGRIAALDQGKWIDLATLCAVDHNSPYYTTDHSTAGVFYAESWLLTHMLSLGEKYRPKYPEFKRMILAGTAPAEAFQKAYGKQMAQVLADLRQYSRAQSIRGLLFDVTLGKSAEDPEIKPVTPFESGLVLAGVLADTSKIDEARQVYMKLGAENPARPEVPEALGYLAWRRGQLGETRAQFAKAAELGSRNARMYYEYSGLASQASEPRELQVSLLRKALDLDPDYRDARLRLGDLLMCGRDYAGALAEFNRLKKVEPEQAFHLFHSIAYAAYLTGDKENARANAKRAADYAKEPDQKAILEQLQVALEERPMERSETITRPRSEEEDEPQPAPQGRAIRETPQLRMRPALTAVEGALDQIDCLGSAARIRMTVAGRPVRLLIDKPGSIEVRGTKTGSFDLRCGPQKPLRTVRVEYLPNEDAERGSIGLVRVMEIR